MRKMMLIALLMLAFAQWVVPGKMLWDKYMVTKHGTLYKFQSAPVDPVNPFKGRYVRLNFSETQYAAKKGHGLQNGQKIFVEFTVDETGFAHIGSLRKIPPAENQYVAATINYINNWDKEHGDIIHIKYPFEEYYTQEFNAPKIEKLYQDSSMQPERTYALVNIYKGDAVIEKFYINDQPVESLLKE